MVVQQQVTAARGGHRWSWMVEEEFLGWFDRVLREGGMEIVFFS